MLLRRTVAAVLVVSVQSPPFKCPRHPNLCNNVVVLTWLSFFIWLKNTANIVFNVQSLSSHELHFFYFYPIGFITKTRGTNSILMMRSLIHNISASTAGVEEILKDVKIRFYGDTVAEIPSGLQVWGGDITRIQCNPCSFVVSELTWGSVVSFTAVRSNWQAHSTDWVLHGGIWLWVPGSFSEIRRFVGAVAVTTSEET